jgi:hypothetical protein
MPYVGFHYLISNNTIEGNISAFGGGISYTGDAEASVVENTIDGNIATYGGGIYCENTTPDFSGNTICENFANNGSGIYSQGSNPRLVNCILWGNIGQQIVGTSNVTYSDIQDGYPGAGNINIYPAFVDTVHNDYRLQWNSSCIDTGDPNPIYNDPDNTRADMGAWYYDQSIPIRVLLIPYSEPIKIPAGGGSFQYAIQFTNIADTILNVLCWCDVTLPSGPPYGPVLGPLNLSLASGQTLNWVRSQAVHAVVPTGIYRYNAFAVTAGDTSRDNFLFIKLGGTGISRSTDAIQPGTAGWVNTAEEFAYTEFYEGIRQLAGVIQPNVFNLSVYPNPFNSSTIISFELFSVSPINLKIYNIYGQEISKLETRNSQPGTNQIEWNAEGLPSGIYFARLEVGELCLTQKMMLLK